MAARYTAAENIPTTDLFSIGQDSALFTSDGVHFNAEGSLALAGEVTKSLRNALAAR